MFADYKSLIVAHYQEKKASNDLPLRLAQPTPGNLKRECLAVFEERDFKKDEKALREFFGPVGEKSSRLETIDSFDINKFRPLVNFLKDLTDSPDEKNIELLAWLINFEPRPFELGRKYKTQNPSLSESVSTQIQDKTESTDDENAISPDQPSNSSDPIPIEPAEVSKIGAHAHLARASSKPGKVIAVLTLLSLSLLAIGVYWLLTRKAAKSDLPGILQKPASAAVVVLDSVNINQKKITNWDTLTPGSIRNVWYFKSHGGLELFTSPGLYPVDQRFRLLPLTIYMYEKYVVPKQHHPVVSN